MEGVVAPNPPWLRHWPGQHRSEETSQRWRAFGDDVTDLTDQGIKPQASRAR